MALEKIARYEQALDDFMSQLREFYKGLNTSVLHDKGHKVYKMLEYEIEEGGLWPNFNPENVLFGNFGMHNHVLARKLVVGKNSDIIQSYGFGIGMANSKTNFIYGGAISPVHHSSPLVMERFDKSNQKAEDYLGRRSMRVLHEGRYLIRLKK
jgi:hypothetical protein